MGKGSLAEHFADQLRLHARLEPGTATDRVLDAFRDVPREAFAGPGPWRLRSPWSVFGPPVLTPDADPRWLYHDMLVVLDEAKGINIGQPSLWARLLARVNVQPGIRILQVGAGVGYYSAILSQLAGPEGRVLAYEVEAELAERAAANLSEYENTTVRHGNAATDRGNEGPFDLIVAFAGVTHVPIPWSEQLAPNARLLLPLTGVKGAGAMTLLQADDEGFRAETIGRCGFYHCHGARDDSVAAEIDAMFFDQRRLDGWRFRIIQSDEAVRFYLPH